MNELMDGLMVVAIMRDEARVWTTGVEPGAKPESIHAPSEMQRHHHVREAQHHRGHDTDHESVIFYNSIGDAVAPAKTILLIGHGKGKADEVLNLTQYWERKRPDIAQKVVGALDSDLEALTPDQILALVRDWFEEYERPL